MTSRNSFYNLLIQDLKQRLWSIALSCLFFLFIFPVNISFTSSMYKRNRLHLEYVNDMTDFFLNLVSVDNKFLTFFIILLSVIIALHGFGYLHNRNQVDFFHSLPISRTRIFTVKYITGLAILVVPYLIFMLTATILTSLLTGIHFPAGSFILNYLFQMLMVILCYNATIFAVSLTGTTVMSIFGSVFFFSYIPLLIMLNFGYKETYFNTYISSTQDFLDVLKYSSPFSMAMLFGNSAFEKQNLLLDLAASLAMAVIFVVLAYLFFKHRHSESAGKAISFKWLEAPLKILVVIPSGLFFALLLSTILNNIFWTVFSTICAIVISHCVIEIIYHSDFKQLFAQCHHMLLCLIVALAIVFIYNYDLLGYDTYRPNLEKIHSIGIYDSSFDSYTFHEPIYSDVNYTGPNMESIESIITKNMYITDKEVIEPVIQNAVSQELERGNYVDEEPKTYYQKFAYIRLRYRLNNGKEIERYYELDTSTIEPIYKKIYESKEFKDAYYPILKTDAKDYILFNYKTLDNSSEKVYSLSNSLPFEKLENGEKILETYKEDLYAHALSTIQETPVGFIRFLTREDLKPLETMYKENLSYNHESFDLKNIHEENALNFDIGLLDSEEIVQGDVGYYPVYPSFTKTLQILEQNGISTK